MMDRSYSFDFSEDNLLREEAADPAGNVQGRYSYTNRDGNEIEVRYSAGAEKGFVIENEVELAKAVAKATKEASETTAGAQGSSPTILDVRKQYSGGNGQLQNKASDR